MSAEKVLKKYSLELSRNALGSAWNLVVALTFSGLLSRKRERIEQKTKIICELGVKLLVVSC